MCALAFLGNGGLYMPLRQQTAPFQLRSSCAAPCSDGGGSLIPAAFFCQLCTRLTLGIHSKNNRLPCRLFCNHFTLLTLVSPCFRQRIGQDIDLSLHCFHLCWPTVALV